MTNAGEGAGDANYWAGRAARAEQEHDLAASAFAYQKTKIESLQAMLGEVWALIEHALWVPAELRDRIKAELFKDKP